MIAVASFTNRSRKRRVDRPGPFLLRFWLTDYHYTTSQPATNSTKFD